MSDFKIFSSQSHQALNQFLNFLEDLKINNDQNHDKEDPVLEEILSSNKIGVDIREKAFIRNLVKESLRLSSEVQKTEEKRAAGTLGSKSSSILSKSQQISKFWSLLLEISNYNLR